MSREWRLSNIEKMKGVNECLYAMMCSILIVLGFNDTSTLVGHFVSSPRERVERDTNVEEIVEEMKERDREERGTGMKGRN